MGMHKNNITIIYVIKRKIFTKIKIAPKGSRSLSKDRKTVCLQLFDYNNG